jgi:hypothetical protein
MLAPWLALDASSGDAPRYNSSNTNVHANVRRLHLVPVCVHIVGYIYLSGMLLSFIVRFIHDSYHSRNSYQTETNGNAFSFFASFFILTVRSIWIILLFH